MTTTKFCNAASASKFRGCMIGGLMGDCLGGPFEFSDVSVKRLNNFFSNVLSTEYHHILNYTDDSSMTISVASSLVEKGQLDAKDMAQKFVAEYFRIQPDRGYGTHVPAVFQALRATNFSDVFLPATSQFHGTGSYGNGAAMRIAPIALFGNAKGEQYIMAAAEECSRITHAHKNGYNGAILQSLAVNAALGLDSSPKLNPADFISNLLEKMEKIEMQDESKPYSEDLQKMKEMYLGKQENISPETIAEYFGNGEAAHRSVSSAIYSFLRGMEPIKDFKNSNPFLRILYFAISVGGDTDTIASMAGSIAGAYYGADIIPEIIQRKCEAIDEVIQLADKLYDLSQTK